MPLCLQCPAFATSQGQVAAVAETRVKRTLSHHVERARAGRGAERCAQGPSYSHFI